MTPDPYAPIAELYDLEHADFRDDVDLLLSFADIVGDPILEMGCGSGRILIPLAQAGFDVTGIDQSPAMLDRARAAIDGLRLEGSVQLIETSMLDADSAPGGPFGLVIFSLNALMHLPTMAAQRAALESALRALDPKGQLIIDVMNPTPDHLHSLGSAPVLEGSWELPDGSTVDKWAHRRIHATTQVIDTLLSYDRVGADGTFRRTRTRFPLRYVHVAELELLLELAGFTEVRMYGSYEMDPLEDESERLFVTAEVVPSTGRNQGTGSASGSVLNALSET
jgi:SAM-dependent methyltransferase